MLLPPGIDDLLASFGTAIRPAAGAVALYVGGSLATGDYRPGISDMDLAAVIARPLGPARQDAVQAVHRELIAAEPAAAKLHCVYVPADDLTDVTREHWTWAVEQFFERVFSGVARAELRAFGFAVFGEPPRTVIPEVTDDALRAAVKGELTGYWTRALDREHIWLEDIYVDLSLITLARADATLGGDGLITKREAIGRLARFEVPDQLITEIRRRRDGERVPVSPAYRAQRAELVYRLVADGIRSLTG
jgi:Nucleotidyltransferase domain